MRVYVRFIWAGNLLEDVARLNTALILRSCRRGKRNAEGWNAERSGSLHVGDESVQT